MTDKKKIIIVSTDFGTEQAEIVQPADQLRVLGHDVIVATPTGEDVQTLEGDRKPASVVPSDVRLSEAVGPFDVVVLPGGTLNSDAARMDEDVRNLVKRQADEGRAVAAICHAPWVLIESGVAAGKTMTGYDSVRTDLSNAGATVVDESAAVCTANGWTLITSRTPRDLDDFIDAIDRL